MDIKQKPSSKAIALSPDILERFDISTGAELPELSSDFATACQARSKKDSQHEYYALIFSNSYAADLEKMQTLRNIDEASVQKLVDFGKVKTGQGSENLCAILTKPSGVSLAKLIEERGPLDESFVISHIFNQLSAAISALHNEGIMHGCINPNNVFYNAKNGLITLKESISEYPGYSQYPSFDTYERMVCHKAGKSNRDPEADFYAMGVTLCCLLNGRHIFKGIPDSIVKRIKFENGSFQSMYSIASANREMKMSSRNENLIKGLLNDKISDRWLEDQIKKWKKREISQPSTSRLHKQSATPFKFMDMDYFSPKYLAHVISNNWGVAKKTIKISDMARWLTFTSKFSDIEDKLFRLTRGGNEEVIIPDEKLARMLFLMDEGGPFRFKDVTFHPDGLGNLLSYLNESGDGQTIETLLKALDHGLLESWISNQPDEKMYKSSVMGWNARNIKFFSRKKDIGFGFERVLYETAKYLPCQSPILKNQYSVGLPSVLANLDSKKLSYNDENSIDNHISAYICRYIDVVDSIKIKQLQNFPTIAKTDEIKYCALLALAQKRAEVSSLPALAQWVREGLNAVLNNLNSQKIKDKFTEELDKAVPSGDLNKIFAIVTDANLVRKDVYGFNEAKQQYKILNFEILKLKSQTNMDQLAYRLGLRVSVVFSYLVCVISVLSLMVFSI